MRQRSARATVSSDVTAPVEVEAPLARDREGGEGVHDVVLAEDAEATGRAAPSARCEREGGARGATRRRRSPGRRPSRPGRTDDAGAAVRRHAGDAVVVGVEHGGAVAGRSVTISAFAARVPSMPPNPPAWARPTLSTTPMSGSAIATRRAISPSPLAPISTTRNACRASMRSIEIGAPTWLLNEPAAATVGPTSEDRAEHVLGARLAVRAGDRRRRAGAERADALDDLVARRGERGDDVVDDDQGHGAGRRRVRRRASAAPASTAAAANRWPSVSSPRHGEEDAAGGHEPRESVSTTPSTTGLARASAVEEEGAADAISAISARVRAITRPTRPRAARRALRPGRSTGSVRPDVAVVLVAGAGAEDRVALAGQRDGRADGRRGRADLVDLVVGVRPRGPRRQGRADRRRVLEARVVVGDDHGRRSPRPRCAAISARFVVSRSPSAPNSMTTLPGVKRPERLRGC